jgi:hypothetical protein
MYFRAFWILFVDIGLNSTIAALNSSLIILNPSLLPTFLFLWIFKIKSSKIEIALSTIKSLFLRSALGLESSQA